MHVCMCVCVIKERIYTTYVMLYVLEHSCMCFNKLLNCSFLIIGNVLYLQCHNSIIIREGKNNVSV